MSELLVGPRVWYNVGRLTCECEAASVLPSRCDACCELLFPAMFIHPKEAWAKVSVVTETPRRDNRPST